LHQAKDAWNRKAAEHLYRREVVSLRDGESLALDWLDACPGLVDNGLPVCILLHGAFQDSRSVTMTGLAQALSTRGFPVVVMNRRGYGHGMRWCEPKMQMFGDDDDLDEVTDLVIRREPNRLVTYIGFSCGAAFASRYVANRSRNSAWLGQNSPHHRLLCGVMLDSGHDVRPEGAISKTQLPSLINAQMKSRYARRNHSALLVDDSEEKAMLRESVEAILKPETGVVETFKAIQGLSGYGDAWLDKQRTRLENIEVPSLFINSRDDPVLVWDNVEEVLDEIKSNPYLALLEFDRGSHGCKYGFWGGHSVVETIIPEWVESCWHAFQCRGTPPAKL